MKEISKHGGVLTVETIREANRQFKENCLKCGFPSEETPLTSAIFMSFDAFVEFLEAIAVENPGERKTMDCNAFDFNEYQMLAARTIGDLSPENMMEHAKSGMVSEIGEFHGVFQKYFQGHGISPEHLQKELGDLLWFIAEFCTGIGWNMGDIAKLNIEKLYARYPDGFTVENSLHRAEGDI